MRAFEDEISFVRCCLIQVYLYFVLKQGASFQSELLKGALVLSFIPNLYFGFKYTISLYILWNIACVRSDVVCSITSVITKLLFYINFFGLEYILFWGVACVSA